MPYLQLGTLAVASAFLGTTASFAVFYPLLFQPIRQESHSKTSLLLEKAHRSDAVAAVEVSAKHTLTQFTLLA